MKNSALILFFALVSISVFASSETKGSEGMAKHMLDYCVNIDDLVHCMISVGYECKDSDGDEKGHAICTYPYDDILVVYRVYAPSDKHGWKLERLSDR